MSKVERNVSFHTAMSTVQNATLRNDADDNVIKTDNFSLTLKSLTVNGVTTVTWMTQDDVGHNVETEKKFSFPVLDTNQHFSFRFQESGSYPGYRKARSL